MNFIIKLFKSKDLVVEILYNLIMVIIDKLIKHVHFIPFKKKFDVEQLGHFFINRVT